MPWKEPAVIFRLIPEKDLDLQTGVIRTMENVFEYLAPVDLRTRIRVKKRATGRIVSKLSVNWEKLEELLVLEDGAYQMVSVGEIYFTTEKEKGGALVTREESRWLVPDMVAQYLTSFKEKEKRRNSPK